MNREIRVGDIVKITADADKLRDMECGYFPEYMSHLPGRLVRVIRLNDGDQTIPAVLGVPTELDIRLGIVDRLDGYWWDLDCVELVEAGDEQEAY